MILKPAQVPQAQRIHRKQIDRAEQAAHASARCRLSANVDETRLSCSVWDGKDLLAYPLQTGFCEVFFIKVSLKNKVFQTQYG